MICEHGNPVRPDGPFTSDQCRVCWLVALRGRAKAAALPCVHLGPRLPHQPCGSALHVCTLHGVPCSRVAACKGAVRVCKDCPDRETGSGVDSVHT